MNRSITNTSRLIVCLGVSLGAGGWFWALTWNWFKQNPEPTKENALQFAWYVTCIFSGFFLPLAIGLIDWYESLPFYTVYKIDRKVAVPNVGVRLSAGLSKPEGSDCLEEPVIVKPPIALTLRCYVLVNCLFVFLETYILPFARHPSGDSFMWLFYTITAYVLWSPLVPGFMYACKVRNFEDESRRAICEQEARRRVREEVQSLLEKV